MPNRRFRVSNVEKAPPISAINNKIRQIEIYLIERKEFISPNLLGRYSRIFDPDESVALNCFNDQA